MVGLSNLYMKTRNMAISVAWKVKFAEYADGERKANQRELLFCNYENWDSNKQRFY